MAEAARRRGVPVVHYVAPQYWAWGPWRLARYRRAIDASLTILPFEPSFFAGLGLTSAYVGHPLLDQIADERGDDHRANATPRRPRTPRPLLVLMPGSRRREIDLHLAPMLRVAERLRRQRRDLRIVIPHRDPRRLEAIRAAVHAAGAEQTVEIAEGPPSPWLAAARAALVKSGTGSLEACLHRVPTCVVYVVDSVFARLLLRWLLTVPYFAGANLCMARRIVPEIGIEREAQWDEVHDAVGRLLDDGPERARCIADLAALRERLGEPGASARVARWILPFCEIDR